MRKKTWIGAIALVVMLGTAGAVGAAQPSAAKDYIGTEKAKQIALQAVSGTVDDVELERKHGRVYYEVEIKRSNSLKEADVHVDAVSGKVTAIIYENKVSVTPAPTASPSEPATPAVPASPAASATPAVPAKPATPAKPAKPAKSETAKPAGDKSKQTISKTEAGSIAAKAVSGTVLKVKKEREDGIFVYEVKLKTDSGIAEVEIAAASGAVLSIEYGDSDDDDDHEHKHKGKHPGSKDRHHNHDHDGDDDRDDD